jgi:hypothetical protein
LVDGHTTAVADQPGWLGHVAKDSPTFDNDHSITQ